MGRRDQAAECRGARRKADGGSGRTPDRTCRRRACDPAGGGVAHQLHELGTVYSTGEVAQITALAHQHGLVVHIDGARLANAAASLGVPLRALTGDLSVDICRSGGRRTDCSARRRWWCATSGSRSSICASRRPACVQDAISRRAVRRADAGRPVAAQRRPRQCDGRPSGGCLSGIPDVRITRPVHCNSVFATLPRDASPCSRVTPTSTHGTSPAERSAGCAPGTRPTVTWTHSPPRCVMLVG